MTYEIDEKDELILEILKKHGDYTVRRIAKRTGIAPSTIHARIRKMKAEGLIRNYTIDIDRKKMGLDIGAYILISADLKMLKEKKKSQRDLALKIRKMPGVENIDVVTGGTDLIARVFVADLKQLDDLLLSRIQMLGGVSNTQTLIIIR
jgi:Lrp/AsnC family transcriptional regulator for asnA, asnC and gidA